MSDGCPNKKLVIIPGAGHLFEEPGALEEAAKVAAMWFGTQFTAGKDVLAHAISRSDEPAQSFGMKESQVVRQSPRP